MRFRCWLALAGVLALAWLPGDDVYGQRGGRGGGGARAGGARAVGGARGGAAVGGARAGGASVGPYGGAGAASRSRGTVVGPAGGSRSVGAGSGSYTTGRGGTINYGGVGRTATGPGGATAGRGVGGVQVTTAGGRTATKVGSVGGVQGPGGYGAVGGRSVGAVGGPGGVAVGGSRGGAAVGPGGAVAGGTRVGAAAGVGGGTVTGVARGAGAVGPYGGYGATSRGVAYGGGVGHYAGYRSGTLMHTQGAYYRTGFRGYNYFNPGWYTAHPAAWRAAAWNSAAGYWGWAPYATYAAFCGYPAEPVIYDYGSNVVYEDNTVYYNAEPVATAAEYATQATDLAAAGLAAKPAEKEEWQALGVFAIIKGEEKEAENVFQLAINKDGVIRGNYYDAVTDAATPVYGSVDKKTQRAAWIVGDKKDTVFETGFGNLSQPETTMLVHFGKDRTDQWMLVRLEPPKEEGKPK